MSNNKIKLNKVESLIRINELAKLVIHQILIDNEEELDLLDITNQINLKDVNHWKNFIPPNIRNIWDQLSYTEKSIFYMMALYQSRQNSYG